MFNVAQILDLIKNKNQVPPEVFETYIEQISSQLNSMGYAEKGFSGGFDFKSFNAIKNLQQDNEQLQMTNALLQTSVCSLELLCEEVLEENKRLKESAELSKLMLKANIIRNIQEM